MKTYPIPSILHLGAASPLSPRAKGSIERPNEINGLTLDRLTVAQVNYICKKYELDVVIKDGKLRGFVPAT